MSNLKVSKVLGVYGTECEIPVFFSFFVTLRSVRLEWWRRWKGVVLMQSLRLQNCFVLCPECEISELFGTHISGCEVCAVFLGHCLYPVCEALELFYVLCPRV